MKRSLLWTIVAVLVVLGQRWCYAVPIVRAYMEAPSYQNAADFWALDPFGTVGGSSFRWWATARLCGSGGTGKIGRVMLSVAYGKDDLGLVISLTPSQASGLGVGNLKGFTHRSVPILVALNTTVQASTAGVGIRSDGFLPRVSASVLADGGPPSIEWVSDARTVWQQYLLGDFRSTDSQIHEFTAALPTHVSAYAGQIGVYELSVIGGSGASVNFDLCATLNDSQGRSALYWRDGSKRVVAPEPATMVVWLLMGLTWAGSGWMYRYAQRWQRWEQEELIVPGAGEETGICLISSGPFHTELAVLSVVRPCLLPQMVHREVAIRRLSSR